MVSRDPLSPIHRPITELNNNTETFASTYLKVHRFSVYKFPPRGVETVNRIYIREGGSLRERIRGGSVYGKINGKKKVDGEPGTIVVLILLETLADIALRSCVVPLLFSFPQQRRGPAT